jgi:hypothetical protein
MKVYIHLGLCIIFIILFLLILKFLINIIIFKWKSHADILLIAPKILIGCSLAVLIILCGCIYELIKYNMLFHYYSVVSMSFLFYEMMIRIVVVNLKTEIYINNRKIDKGKLDCSAMGKSVNQNNRIIQLRFNDKKSGIELWVSPKGYQLLCKSLCG